MVKSHGVFMTGLTRNKNTTEDFEECTKVDFTSYKKHIHTHLQN